MLGINRVSSEICALDKGKVSDPEWVGANGGGLVHASPSSNLEGRMPVMPPLDRTSRKGRPRRGRSSAATG